MKEKYANEEIFCHDIDINLLIYSKLIGLFIITKLQVQHTNIKCLYPTYGYKIQMWRYVTFICLYLISADLNLYEVISSFIFLSAYNFYFKFLSAFALFHHLLFSFCIFITFLFAHVLHKVTLFAFFIDFDDIFSI